MAVLALAVLLLAMTGHTSANWCVCKTNIGEAQLQKTLDYACGAGADCNPIHTNGVCYNPNTVLAHCNYAVNSYFQKKGQAVGSCDFAGTATVSSSDPSVTGCSYPSSASSTTTGTTPSSTTPSTTTPSTTTNPSTTPTTGTTSTTPSTTTTPYGATPGVLGGIGSSLGPTGAGGTYNNDESGAFRLIASSFVALFFSGLMLLWG
ncbi:hypothetical protein UlMin_008385 [Ulmus minor]